MTRDMYVLAVDFTTNPTAPPGTEAVQTILNWLAWGVALACVVGVLITAGSMALSHKRSPGEDHISRLGWVLGACILGASAGSLVGVFI